MVKFKLPNRHLIGSDPLFIKLKDQLDSISTLSQGDGILISVSGGVDSISLLVLMHSLAQFKIYVAHINHNLREESNYDEEFVKSLCLDLGIECFTICLDPMSIKKGSSIEKWARTERYRFLKKISVKTNSKWIMTAHHANDQAETILMNLSRQAGIMGLRGISKKNGNLIRPLLNFKKHEINKFSIFFKIPYCQDKTNSNISIPRNFIRHKVLNPWEKDSPAVIEGLQASAEHFNDWKVALDHLIIQTLVPKIKQTLDTFSIPIEIIEPLPKIAQIRLLQIIMDNSDSYQWSKHQMQMLEQFINKVKIGNTYQSHIGWHLLHDRGYLIGGRISDKDVQTETGLILNTPTIFNNYEYELSLSDMRHNSNNKESLDWGTIKNCRLKIRKWEDGDIFQPLGMSGRQKISDFLINEKVDRISKESQSVITADGEIIWVCGMRISNSVRLTNKTTDIAYLVRKLISS